MILTTILILPFLAFLAFVYLIATGRIKIDLIKKWKCTEKGCEENLEGKFNNKDDCEKQCDKTENTQMSLEESIPNKKLEKNNAWACTNNYQCVKAETGYTSKEMCEKNCKKPLIFQNYYYPQSMIPRYRRPVRIPGRRHGRRHGRRPDRKHSHTPPSRRKN